MTQFPQVLQGVSVEKPQRLATFGLFVNGRPKISSIVRSQSLGLPEEICGAEVCFNCNTKVAPCDFDPQRHYIPKQSIIIYNSNAKMRLEQDAITNSIHKQRAARKYACRKLDFVKINRQKFKGRISTKSEGSTPQNVPSCGSSSCEQTLLFPLSDMSSLSSNGSQSSKIITTFKTDRSSKSKEICENNIAHCASPIHTGSPNSGKVYHSPVSSGSGEIECGRKKIKPKVGPRPRNLSRRNRTYVLQKQSREYTENLSQPWYPKQTSSMSMNVSRTSSRNSNECEE